MYSRTTNQRHSKINKALPRTHLSGKRLLIATPSRIEIPVTYSYERRKHFLIATRNGVSRITCHEQRLTSHKSQGSIARVSYWQQRKKHFLPYGKQPCKRFLSTAVAQNLFHALDIRGNVHADRIVFRFHHANAVTILEPAKLFQLLHALQVAGRQ